MAILTRTELEQRLGVDDVARLADRDSSAGEDTNAVQSALDDAEAEVMAYVRMVTPAPVPDPAPPVLKRLVAIVARYNLWRRDTAADHPAYIAYQDSVKELQAIAAGRVALPLAADQSNAASSGAGAVYVPTRLLNDDALAAMLPT